MSTEAPENTTAMKRQRWLPRFSLRTLLLFVLLIASSATLWWNWGPWEVSRLVQEDGDINLYATPARYLAYMFQKRGADERIENVRFVVRDAATLEESLPELSKRVSSWITYANLCPNQPPDFKCVFSESGKYVLLSAFNQTSLLYNTKTNEFREVPCENNHPGEFLNGDAWLRMIEGPLFELPALKAHTSHNIDGTYFNVCANDRWLAVNTDKMHVFRIGGSEPVRELEVSGILENMTLNGDVLIDNACLGMDIQDVSTGRRLKPVNGKTINGKWIANCPAENAFLTEQGEQSLTLWRLKPEINEIQTYPASYKVRRPVMSGSRLILTNPIAVYRVSDGAMLWTEPGECKAAADGRFMAARKDGDMSIVDAESGRHLFELSCWRWNSYLPAGETKVYFLKGKMDFVTLGVEVTDWKKSLTAEPNSSNRIALWKLKRPYQWYGVAWLPEFWLTTVLALGLIWSLWRDRTQLTSQAK